MESILRREERIVFGLRALYSKYGYRPYRMSKFEEYDFYAENRSFLHSEAILTFTGLDGKLLALKPDVTLSIVKNTKGSRDAAERVYYNENVYRARKSAGEDKEIMQVGLEYIGEVDAYATLEVLLLAQKSLKAISDAYILDVSHMGFVAGLMEEVALPYAQQDRILDRSQPPSAVPDRRGCAKSRSPSRKPDRNRVPMPTGIPRCRPFPIPISRCAR